MVWAKFPDSYPRHRKVWPLSDAAFRLDTSGIMWSCDVLSDGHIPADDLVAISPVKQPRKAAAELVRRGRWHEPGHDCPRCPAVADGWVIHDFLLDNPDRASALAKREARAKSGRLGGEASGRSRSAGKPPPGRGANAKQNASDSLSKSGSEMPTKPVANPEAPTNPVTPKNVLEEISASAAVESNRAREDAAAAETDALEPLAAACTAAGMPVRWDKLRPDQRIHIAELVSVHGVGRLVKAAQAAWWPDRPALLANAWLGHWDALPPPGRRLTAVPEMCQSPAHARQAMPCRLCAADRKAAS
jgi:hypothetical protein